MGCKSGSGNDVVLVRTLFSKSTEVYDIPPSFLYFYLLPLESKVYKDMGGNGGERSGPGPRRLGCRRRVGKRMSVRRTRFRKLFYGVSYHEKRPTPT